MEFKFNRNAGQSKDYRSRKTVDLSVYRKCPEEIRIKMAVIILFLTAIFDILNNYFNPAILCSIVAIFAKASASFCLSFAKTFSGAPATNFSLASLL